MEFDEAQKCDLTPEQKRARLEEKAQNADVNLCPGNDGRDQKNKGHDLVDEAGMESFPASDPPSYSGGREQE